MTESYAVDDGDKLTSVTQGGTTVKSYSYDAAGRTLGVTSSAGTTTLGYDYEGRVTTISGPGVSNTFTYNGLDTRVGKVDPAGTSTYRRDGAGVTDDVLSDGAAVYTPGVSQRRSGSTTFDLSDRTGTAARQTSASASTTATRTYDAFGMLVASTRTPQRPFGFAGTSGYQEDGDSGLKLLGHRYYDASTGRFLTRDPAQDGRNWYGYCNGNPLKAVDDDGLITIVGGKDLDRYAVLMALLQLAGTQRGREILLAIMNDTEHNYTIQINDVYNGHVEDNRGNHTIYINPSSPEIDQYQSGNGWHYFTLVRILVVRPLSFVELRLSRA